MATLTDEQIRETEERSKQNAEIRQEHEHKQAEAKAAFRVELDKMVAEFKAAGIIKPCVNCGKDWWGSALMTLSGRKIESAPDSGLVGMFAGIFDYVHSATVLTCLVLTCSNCGAVQFFDMEPFNAAIKAREQTEAATSTLTDTHASGTMQT